MNSQLPRRVDPDDASAFWTISTTAMTGAEATRAASLIRQTYPNVYADPVNPREFMTLHLDRWTAQTLRDATAAYIESGGNAGSMLEVLDEWLAAADPVED